MERCGLRMQPRSHIHTPRSVGKCEGMNPRTPKWASTLGIRVPIDSQTFKDWFEGSKLIGLKKYSYHWNILKCKCLKWIFMNHLNTYNTSYGWKKG
jgi:hypothetical protein